MKTATRNFGLGFILLIALFVVGCGSATPTVPPTPVTSTQPTPIGGVPTTAPVVPPTATVPPLPTAGASSSEAATPTKFAVALPSVTSVSAPRPTATQPPVVQPSGPTGRFAYSVVTGDASPKFQTIWVANANGTGARQILDHAQWPALSPDGTRIAYFGRPEGGSAGIYIANADGGSPVLVVNASSACCVNWSRDGAWIVYTVSNKPNQPGGPISTLKMDGAYKTVVALGVAGNGPAFSPDGKQVVYSGCLPNTNTCGLMVVAAGGGAPRMVTSDNGGNADWAARGIVYQASDGAGHRQVFFVNPDGTGKKQLTNGKSNDGQPVWSRDGGSIFWRSDQNGTAWAIYVMSADGSNQRKLIDNVPPHPDLWGWESLSVGP